MYGMFLISGTARITFINENGNEAVLNKLSAGEVCSLLVLSGLSGRDYPGTLIAESEVEVLYVLKSSFCAGCRFMNPSEALFLAGCLKERCEWRTSCRRGSLCRLSSAWPRLCLPSPRMKIRWSTPRIKSLPMKSVP